MTRSNNLIKKLLPFSRVLALPDIRFVQLSFQSSLLWRIRYIKGPVTRFFPIARSVPLDHFELDINQSVTAAFFSVFLAFGESVTSKDQTPNFLAFFEYCLTGDHGLLSPSPQCPCAVKEKNTNRSSLHAAVYKMMVGRPSLHYHQIKRFCYCCLLPFKCCGYYLYNDYLRAVNLSLAFSIR